MAITYTYTVLNLTTYESYNDLSDVVCNVTFKYEASEGTGDDKKTANYIFQIELSVPDLANFKAYADLTEADVVMFIENSTNVDFNKSVVNKLLADQALPAEVIKELPWA
tara:strand:- start:115 stop:444 length:330 start_codon:yes stop_codon:yes gene_type:complete